MKSRRKNRRSSKGRLKNTLSVAVIVIVLAVFSYLGYFYLQLSNNSQINEANLCPAEGEVGYFAIVLDLTDPLTYQQANRLKLKIQNQIKKLEEGTLITVGVVHIEENEQGEKASICKPPSGENANPLYENKMLIEEKYQEKFEIPLHQKIDAMMIAEEQPNSPIIESMTSLVASNPSIRHKDYAKTIVLVSDLVQNSPTLSFFKRENWDNFRRTKGFTNLSGILEDFDVQIIRIPLPKYDVLDERDIEDFWVRYFDAHKVRSVSQDLATLGKI